MARELEQFLGRGEEKFFWIFTYKNAGGAIVGGFLGSRIGQIVGSGGLVMLMTIVGILVGVGITLNRRGLMWGRRLWLTVLFYVRSALRPRELDSAVLYEVVEERERAVVIRKKGQTILAPRGAGTPSTPGAPMASSDPSVIETLIADEGAVV